MSIEKMFRGAFAATALTTGVAMAPDTAEAATSCREEVAACKTDCRVGDGGTRSVQNGRLPACEARCEAKVTTDANGQRYFGWNVNKGTATLGSTPSKEKCN